ncbi:MAG: hypothetical protein HN553_00120, partial [Opitutae bacterium]|nr:hypothetical protein [Opitutae bacterium]
EALDVSFARTDLQMLAKLTGGKYISVEEMRNDWKPAFAEDLPSVKKRHSLASVWVLFLCLFLAAGGEWLLRRQVGLR